MARVSAPVPPAAFDAEELAAFVADLLEETALREVLQARLDQVLVHGHTAESDAAMPVSYFISELGKRVGALSEGVQFNQALRVQRRRTVKLAALSLALLQRIDHEIAKEAAHG